MNDFELQALFRIAKIDSIVKMKSVSFSGTTKYFYALYEYKNHLLCLPIPTPIIELSCIEKKASMLKLELKSHIEVLEQYLFKKGFPKQSDHYERSLHMICALIENEIMYLSHFSELDVLDYDFSSSTIKDFVRSSDQAGLDRHELFGETLDTFGFDKATIMQREGIVLN